MPGNDRIRSYAEFWPYYLRAHCRPATRALHYLAAAIVLAFVALIGFTGDPAWLLAAAAGGYGAAWIGHFFIEGNQPATFRYPLWSFISEWRMVALAVSGRLKAEFEKHQIR
jgi:hypothetical protein